LIIYVVIFNYHGCVYVCWGCEKKWSIKYEYLIDTYLNMKTLEKTSPMKISKVKATLPVAQVITITTPVYVQHTHEHIQWDYVTITLMFFFDDDVDVVDVNNRVFGLDLESQIMIANNLNNELTIDANYNNNNQECVIILCLWVTITMDILCVRKTCFII